MHFTATSWNCACRLTLADLPTNVVTVNIHSVFQHFGEVTHIFIQQDGRRAHVVLQTCYKNTNRGTGNGLTSFSRLSKRNCWRHWDRSVSTSGLSYVSRLSLK
ncbi:hypothetical protein BGY98DRAFT_994288 [Russula aff. rugulosa BPL654]|nr:hypothetical protein BGY98DRAFT_994288 [Russula aff. rugulosa BPL654]